MLPEFTAQVGWVTFVEATAGAVGAALMLILDVREVQPAGVERVVMECVVPAAKALNDVEA